MLIKVIIAALVVTVVGVTFCCRPAAKPVQFIAPSDYRGVLMVVEDTASEGLPINDEGTVVIHFGKTGIVRAKDVSLLLDVPLAIAARSDTGEQIPYGNFVENPGESEVYFWSVLHEAGSDGTGRSSRNLSYFIGTHNEWESLADFLELRKKDLND